MSQIDNIVIQVRARLQSESIKLWLEPYYVSEVGCIESKIEELAEDFSRHLSISVSNCRLALIELQDGAIRKLASRKEFQETGIATFTIRLINNNVGTRSISEIHCPLSALGSELLKRIAEKLNLTDPNQVKCISAGKIIDPSVSLEAQDIKNNQQLMVIVSETDSENANNEAMYDRIRKIKMDVEAIVDSSRQLLEMEDQDGNAIFLPPKENRALLIAMGFYEKARAAISRQHYDEALILLLEADEHFILCNSKFLDSVDNYALVNLDIVWCYLCLKNVTQLPDAQRRLEICEKSFRRSYGANWQRLYALKGENCPERALILRLYLLQGVVFFHQNQRNEAYEKLEMAQAELNVLKVDENALVELIDMGYEVHEARIALRACSNNIEAAVNFIQDRKMKLKDARQRSEKERDVNERLIQKKDANWVNPRSVCTLVDMGFGRELVVLALRQTKNNIPNALDLLQHNSDELQSQISPIRVDNDLVAQLRELGFTESKIQMALATTQNNLDDAMEFLVETFSDEAELEQGMQRILQTATQLSPSTSTGNHTLVDKLMEKASAELESLRAYKRFKEDLSRKDEDYLDLPLVQEEQIINEYIRFLGN